MAEILLEEVNPNGNIQAVVECDDHVCYFYLFVAPDTQFGMKSVWVGNHSRAPEDLDIERMQSGSPPRNPARHCRHTAGRAALAAEDLRVVWLPEGNGAALYERDEILAIIPPWSGTNGFYGYARDNIGHGPVAWELSRDNVLVERFKRAQSYWRKWDDDEFWPSIQSSQIAQLEKVFGRLTKYYAIDGDKWPPKAMMRFAWKDRTVLVTVGVALRPQPNVEMVTETPEQLRRIELGAVLPGSWSEEAVQGFERYIAANPTCPGPNTRGSVRDTQYDVTHGRIRITQRLYSSMSIPASPKLPWKSFWAIRSTYCGSSPSLKRRDRWPSI
ncbi:MAG TPA: hypothetical protein VKC66_32650 [Xanthobacteraceae bacterium]|nr:hypothetical protein [Xanthobacteraceae bacterium]